VSEILDELARTVARPMPRSRALRVLGGALVSAAVPGLVPKRAVAAPLKGCDPKACGTNTVCGIKFLEGCTLACCSKSNPICFTWMGVDRWTPIGGLGGYCSAHAAVGTEAARVVCCCPPGSKKGNLPSEPPCMCDEPCGPKKLCCARDQYCSRSGCTDCDSFLARRAGAEKCGKGCCSPKEFCADAQTGACCYGPDSGRPQHYCSATSGHRAGGSRRRAALCCERGEKCCTYVDDSKDILRVDCCTKGQTCSQGKCV
jgi:hypothetical protein